MKITWKIIMIDKLSWAMNGKFDKKALSSHQGGIPSTKQRLSRCGHDCELDPCKKLTKILDFHFSMPS